MTLTSSHSPLVVKMDICVLFMHCSNGIVSALLAHFTIETEAPHLPTKLSQGQFVHIGGQAATAHGAKPAKPNGCC